MSKYRDREDYHYRHYSTGGDPYREHIRQVVQQVNRLARVFRMAKDRDPSIADLGCGEGFVVDLLSLTHGDRVFGMELDERAVELARDRQNYVLHGDITKDYTGTCEIVLFLDVLEHVKGWRKAIQAAVDGGALWILIALPDSHDPYAVNTSPLFHETVRDYLTLMPWKLLLNDRRLNRHVMLFGRVEKS